MKTRVYKINVDFLEKMVIFWKKCRFSGKNVDFLENRSKNVVSAAAMQKFYDLAAGSMQKFYGLAAGSMQKFSKVVS